MANKYARIPQKRATFLKGSPPQISSIPKYNQQQENLLQQILKALAPQIQQFQQAQNQNQNQNNNGFEPIRNQYMQNFYNHTIPTLAERFSGIGGTSPDIYKTLGAAGGQLQNDLAALESQYNLQNRNQDLNQQSLQSQNLMNLLQLGLADRNNSFLIPGQQSGISKLFGGGLNLAGQYFGNR